MPMKDACPACDYDAPDTACDECGAGPGEKCLPHCTAPFGPGGPYEHHDPADQDDERDPAHYHARKNERER